MRNIYKQDSVIAQFKTLAKSLIH